MNLAGILDRPGTARSRGERIAEAVAVRLVRLVAGSTRRRVLIWNSMRRTLDSDFSIREAIETAIDAAPRDGARRFMLRRWQYAYADGERAFAAEVARWVPASEGMIFGSLGSGNAAGVLAAAARVAEVSQTLVQAVRSAVTGPGITLAMTLVVVWGSGGFVLPAFRRMSDPEQWTTLGQLGYAVATGLYEYDLAIVAALVALIAGFWAAVLRWTGGWRRKFDDYVPFSLYRVISGAAFLMMVLELMKLGVDLNERTWERLSERASPYVRSRIEAIQDRMVRGGMGLGRAMRAAGTGFPDYELVAVGAAMDGRPGWDEEMSRFLDRWLRDSEVSIKAMAAGMSVFMTVMCGFLIVMVMSPAMQTFVHLRKIGG